MNAHRVFLIDDHPVTLLALKSLLTNEEDIVVEGVATGPRDAVCTLEANPVDLAILEVGISGVAGLDLIQDLRIRTPKVKILCFSGHEEVFFAERSLRAGAFGYLMKTADPATIMRAVRTVLRGQVFLSDAMGRRVLGRMVGTSGAKELAPISSLSNRELQIIHHIGESRDNRQIARLTGVSLKTVEAHRSRIKEKLSLRSTSDLIRFATYWVQREDSFLEG